MQIAEVDFSLDSASAGIVSLPVNVSTFHAATGEPESEPIGIVSRLIFPVFRGQAGATEFPTPDHQRILEQTTLLEILK